VPCLGSSSAAEVQNGLWGHKQVYNTEISCLDLGGRGTGNGKRGGKRNRKERKAREWSSPLREIPRTALQQS